MSTTTMKSQNERPIGPRMCQPWCQLQDGHPDEVFIADQACERTEAQFPVSLYPSVERSEGTYAPQQAEVYISQAPGQVPTFNVHLVNGPGLGFTIKEARTVAVALIRAADNLEEAQG